MINLSTGFQESKSYQAYNSNNVYKCNVCDLENIIRKISSNGILERCLVEIPNTVGLTHDLVSNLSDNVDVRIIGGLTNEYSKSIRNDHMDYLREKATYSRNELETILSKFDEIESHIDPNWNKYEKALYLYEYMKNDIAYRTPRTIGPNGYSLDINGNAERVRTWDTLIGLTNQLSTCNGYAHIYTELCTRQGIECNQVGGKYLSQNEGDHAWNIVTIDGKSFMVDIIWDSMNIEKGINATTGFGTTDLSMYNSYGYIEKSSQLVSINRNWIDKTCEKVSSNIPKEKMSQEKIENFLKCREIDRQRMMMLRTKMVENLQTKNIIENQSVGKTL